MAPENRDSFPPLPTQIPQTSSQNTINDGQQQDSAPALRAGPPSIIPRFTSIRLRKGTWLFNYKKDGLILPIGSGSMDGTFRFEAVEGMVARIRASGDMYRRPITFIPRHKVGNIWIGPMWIPGPAPPKDQGIPILPLDQYEGYLRVTSVSAILASDNSFELEFEKYKWNATNKTFSTTGGTAAVVEETYIARLAWKTALPGWPSAADYLTGDVRVKSTGAAAGQIEMGWVSDKWRRLGLEMDAVEGCGFPLANSAQRTIWQLLEDAGFQVSKQVVDEPNITDTPTSIWTDAELHATMLAHRRTVDLNKEWTYHALMVPLFDRAGVIGIMYDDVVFGSDTNQVAREGFAVAAHLPTGDPASWGNEANRLLQDAHSSFVRTTIHELGHALGMHHPDAYTPTEPLDQTYMCQTWSLIQNAQQTGVTYPNNIQWTHSPKVQERLRHYPDVRIRPGGVQFNTEGGVNGAAPWIPPADAAPPIPGLSLQIKPVLGEIPIGAPVRVDVTLHNSTEHTIEVPREIGLSGNSMFGDVQDSNGMRRPFKPLVECHDTANPLVTLDAGQSTTTSMTLLAGRQGPLFPSTGVHTITAILNWTQHDDQGSGVNIWLDAKTTVMVTGARSESHAAAAHRILAEPETLLSLVFAGDHLEKGNEAIEQACGDATLRSHYACIRARRYASSFMGRKPDVGRARELLTGEDAVMSEREKRKMQKLLGSDSRG